MAKSELIDRALLDMPSDENVYEELVKFADDVASAEEVDAIPKDQYEQRLKADMVAMLEKLYMEIEELDTPSDDDSYDAGIVDCEGLIQEKINSLKGEV